MPLSKAKKDKMAIAKRREKIKSMALSGGVYFMDYHHDSQARKYIETGDEKYLIGLPDYGRLREIIKQQNANIDVTKDDPAE